MFRMLMIAGAAATALTAVPAFANDYHHDYNPRASARAAQDWGQNASALAPQVPPSQALDPQGPTLVASQPVPDTPRNRARFGRPLSRSGKLTAPIGD
ncbi:MAG TPA: hypothetical protein VMU93_05700 [Caulobacteraceae bacterium]|nr:hypothetical protein [Caulobacteraceae bacterium]